MVIGMCEFVSQPWCSMLKRVMELKLLGKRYSRAFTLCKSLQTVCSDLGEVLCHMASYV